MSNFWTNCSFESDLFSELVDLNPSDWFTNQTDLVLEFNSLDFIVLFCNCMLKHNQYIFKCLSSYDLQITWWQIFKLVFYCIMKHGMWIRSYSNQELASAKSALYSISNPLMLNYWAIKLWASFTPCLISFSHTHTHNWIHLKFCRLLVQL